MRVIAIETSCDETAVAVIEGNKEHITVLSNVISSQIKLHAKYGGVVPNLAAREHVKNIAKVFEKGLQVSGFKIQDIDLIAVTRGPGLGPALLVGLTFARTLAHYLKKPLIGVNHMDGHIHSNWLGPVAVKHQEPSTKSQINPKLKILNSKLFPALNLIVSGGHTELVLMKGHGQYRIIGETLDDAVGEAFDKAARLLGLGYPGGPAISKLAEKGDPAKYPLPRPMLHSKNYDFSYSGLKTAVLYLIRDLGYTNPSTGSTGSPQASSGQAKKMPEQVRADIAASFQEAAIDVLIQKTVRAAKEYNVRTLLLSGGVSANKLLRQRIANTATELGIHHLIPEMQYTTDNAAMIAAAGYFAYIKEHPPSPRLRRGSLPTAKKKTTDPLSVVMDANLVL